MRILVVEDSRTQALIIERMLKTQGWDVISALNGQEGMQKVRTNKPDIILSDLEMPIIDGFDFCRLVKGSSYKNTPFILLTSMGELDHMVRGFELGADDYITKPVRERELYARLRSFQRIKDYQDQLQVSLDAQRSISKKLEKSIEQQMLELEQAKATQRSILPESLPQLPGIRMVKKYNPMNKIGGDFYDVLELGEDRLGILVADVTGHGIPAALISFMASSAFKTHCKDGKGPEETMTVLNAFLNEKIESNKFVTAWYGVYDLKSRCLSYVTAGHPPALLVRKKNKQVVELVTEGIALGLFGNDINDLTSATIRLEAGDKLLIYTDGIYEMADGDNQLFGGARLQKYSMETSELPIQEWIETLYDHVLTFSGQFAYDDDITLLALEVMEEGEALES